jgi:hypothetical protein
MPLATQKLCLFDPVEFRNSSHFSQMFHFLWPHGKGLFTSTNLQELDEDKFDDTPAENTKLPVLSV